jgi:hypothetical protein
VEVGDEGDEAAAEAEVSLEDGCSLKIKQIMGRRGDACPGKLTCVAT